MIDCVTRQERLRFLQGAFFGASLSMCGHSKSEIADRFAHIGEAWGISRSEFEASFDEMLAQLDAVEREQLMH
ncbi:MAG TPA: hypothetical protein VH187_01420 [Scandinavium sp.]|jgi:hypothetical protein|uniref:hypothetical protein n=1 Tax=Scandinavium sp. TaxID=2830653 RepID=UPI002E37A15C|nr:hypothetical protein [Scandinavium sp.]HEX4499817.1 hypothetical protein [Scandinavium sp.]